MIAFLESSYEDAVRKAILLGGDADAWRALPGRSPRLTTAACRRTSRHERSTRWTIS
jgi:hypothetical protein